MTNTTISSMDDIIDSRDVIARIEELEEFEADLEELDDDDKAELKSLKELASEGEDCADWPHGETLIRESYFTEYAQELAEDCGMVNKENGWPNNCIDWEEAASQLQVDYTSVEFDGITYYLRS